MCIIVFICLIGSYFSAARTVYDLLVGVYLALIVLVYTIVYGSTRLIFVCLIIL